MAGKAKAGASLPDALFMRAALYFMRAALYLADRPDAPPALRASAMPPMLELARQQIPRSGWPAAVQLRHRS